jgi:hypothetical protein
LLSQLSAAIGIPENSSRVGSAPPCFSLKLLALLSGFSLAAPLG